MNLFSSQDRAFAEALSRLVYTNPFLPERIELEREALKDGYKPSPPVWSMRVDRLDEEPNLLRLGERAVGVAEAARKVLVEGAEANSDDLQLYEDVASYALYHTYRNRLYDLIEKSRHAETAQRALSVPFWQEFRHSVAFYFEIEGRRFDVANTPEHLLALCFQVRRAFQNIFYYVIGGSLPAARLRAQIWQSVFTHDFGRYRRALYRTIGDVTTLITGPSGTGKELVARAIALSRYIPFDAHAKAFRCDPTNVFLPLNLSALSPTLIESELFGHRRGAFTGATSDHRGWLETCSEFGSVFLDEIGELDAAIQVKLLRVLQSRVFQRLGDTEQQVFRGKVIAATNRPLADDVQSGAFRHDLYYRLCADTVVTPSLAEQLADMPEDLPHLVGYVARSVAGEAASDLADEVVTWIEAKLGRDYAWPGNFRELEQCVRNIMIRGAYRPLSVSQGLADADKTDRLLQRIRNGSFTMDELISVYVTLVYAQEGSFLSAAKKLGMDRRTVKSRVDHRWLDET